MFGKFSKGTREDCVWRKRSEESDEPIVAGKRGNARGCEGPLREKKGRCKSNGEKNNVERLQ